MPQKFFQKILAFFNRSENNYYGPRKNVVRYEIQDGVWLEVYWKVLEIGRGPGVSFYAFGEEVLRFDCFGENRGHFHVNLKQPSKIDGAQNRLYFYEKSVENQINRTAFELAQNLLYYLQRNRHSKIRNLRLDTEKLKTVILKTSDQMLRYSSTISELKYPEK